MCKMGDIIVVNKYIGEDGKIINAHSFVVVNDEGGTIAGLDYNLVTTVISSFKSEEQRKRKLSYEGNVEIPTDAIKEKDLKKPSYTKADQAFYFNKNKLDYYVLASFKEDFMDELLKVIVKLAADGKLKQIVDNL